MAVLRACSPIATALIALLLLPRPVTAVPHNHGHKHMHRHVSSGNDLITLGPESLARRDAPLKLGDQQRMSKEDVEKMMKKGACDMGDWPLPSSVPLPVVDEDSAQLNLFARPESSTPNTLTMYNYCPYDLYFVHVKEYGVVLEDGEGTTLPAGGSASRTLAGTTMKVSKSKDLTWPLQIEYAGDFYDMSLIDCLGTTDGEPLNNARKVTITSDTSRCAGHEAGLHLSQPVGPTFQCDADLWCDNQAFMYEVSRCEVMWVLSGS